jgi:glycosyltransferase involved in cell wall biosynthesis
MMWYKGLRLTLDALRRLKDAGKPFRMIFVGDGADRGEIESYARTLDLGERCIFTGAIHDREVLRAYFCAADLFLFPSTFDTNGLVVREAAACSLASVIVRGSCAAEGVTDGETGFFIEETAESMAELLLQIGGRREICRAVGQRAMEQIYLSWEDSVARAWDRYGVVCDNYRTAGKRAPVKAWPREFIRAIDDVNEGLRRLRESHAHDWNNDRYL